MKLEDDSEAQRVQERGTCSHKVISTKFLERRKSSALVKEMPDEKHRNKGII